jgi:hypothetical protein
VNDAGAVLCAATRESWKQKEITSKGEKNMTLRLRKAEIEYMKMSSKVIAHAWL